MRKLSFFALSSFLALWVGGCATEPTVDQAASPVPVAPAPQAVAPTSPPATVPAAPFAQPSPALVPPPPPGALPADLISSTNPDQRVRDIERNRPDPFAFISANPSVVRNDQAAGFSPPPFTPQAVDGVPQAPYGINPSAPPAGIRRQSVPTGARLPANQNGATRRTAGGSPGQTAARPGTNAGQGAVNLTPGSGAVGTLTPLPPPPPQPDLARAVQVTGVMQIGNTLHAIVKAPNESTTRYVRVGQTLANGQVLVKAIDITGAEPAVILEQYGVEVRTAVGSGASPAQPPGVPAAAVPGSPAIATSLL